MTDRPTPDKPPAVPGAPEVDPDDMALPTPPEVGGRAGPDPVRYGDWEKGGIAVDF